MWKIVIDIRKDSCKYFEFFRIFQRSFLFSTANEQNDKFQISRYQSQTIFLLKYDTNLTLLKEFIIFRGIHTELSIRSWKKRGVQTGGEEKQPAACVLARCARRQREVRVREYVHRKRFRLQATLLLKWL